MPRTALRIACSVNENINRRRVVVLQLFVLVIAWYKKIKIAIAIIREASTAVRKARGKAMHVVVDGAPVSSCAPRADARAAGDAHCLYCRGARRGHLLPVHLFLHQGACVCVRACRA